MKSRTKRFRGDAGRARLQQVDAARASHLPALLLPYLGLGMSGLLIVGLRPSRALYLLSSERDGVRVDELQHPGIVG